MTLFQDSCCDKPFSQAWDSLLFFLCTLLSYDLQDFLFVFGREVDAWNSICTYYIRGYQVSKTTGRELSEECLNQPYWGEEADLQPWLQHLVNY